MIAIDFKSAEQYAAHLATYIASPIKIESLVKLEFDKAPPLHKIADLRYKVEQSAKRRKRLTQEEAANDNLFWQPRTFVPNGVPKGAALKRVRDYIIIVPKGDNPFRTGAGVGKDLARSVAKDFGVTPEQLCGTSREKYLVAARSVVAKLLHVRGWSYPRIAQAMGRKDHSTAHHAVNVAFAIYSDQFPMVLESYNKHLALMEDAAQAVVQSSEVAA